MNLPSTLSFTEPGKDVCRDQAAFSHRFGFKERGHEAGRAKSSANCSSRSRPQVWQSRQPMLAPLQATHASTLTRLAHQGRWSAILAAIAETSGDTFFEQLTCAGYNPLLTREPRGCSRPGQGEFRGIWARSCTAVAWHRVRAGLPYAFFGGVWNALGTCPGPGNTISHLVKTGQPMNGAVFRLSNSSRSLPRGRAPSATGFHTAAARFFHGRWPPAGPTSPVPVWGIVFNILSARQPSQSAA